MIPGTAYRHCAVQLEERELLVLYTDGVNEAQNERGEQLGFDGLLEVAANLPKDSADAAGEALLTALAGFRRMAPPSDDVTVIVMQVDGRSQR